MPIKEQRRPKSILSLLFVVLYISCFNNCASTSESGHFYFAQITDTHCEGEGNLARTAKAAELINALPMEIKCVVHTGDIVTDILDNDELRDTVLAVMDLFDAPVHYVPGNHDIYPEKQELLSKIFREDFGPLISAAEYEGVIFIFVFTEPFRESFIVEGYDPLPQLKEQLEAAGGKPVILFHHAPSAGNFYKNELRPGWDEILRDQWVELINAYNVKAVITGHYHSDQHNWVGEVPLFVSSSIATYGGRHASFRVYEYTDGQVSYRTTYFLESD